MSEGLAVILAAAIFLVAGLSFHAQTKAKEFEELLKSGQRLNLNLFTLLGAFFRKKNDPLRDAHIKIAKIGLTHFVLAVLGLALVVILSTSNPS